jgi:hypothetical protein
LEAVVLLSIGQKLEPLGYGRFANLMGKAIHSTWLEVVVVDIIIGF